MIYEFEEFSIDLSKRLLIKGGAEQIPLTPKVFDTLLCLVRNAGKVVGKDELMREIWADSVVEENNLNQNISILRRIFREKPGEQRFIVTVAGHGYRFVPDVRKTINDDAELRPVGQDENAESVGTIGDTKRPVNPKWLAGIAISAVLVLAASGLYLWNIDRRTANAPIKSVAVLPFKPLVVENRNEALELGMADTLISKLSGIEEVVVRPLSTIRRYDSVDQDTLAAAQELDVDSIIDGTIQTWGERIRVSAKLIRTRDGKQLWAGQFDEKFTDIFAVQDSISEKVAAALKIRLSGKEHSTKNLQAYQLYMKGRYNIAKGTPPDLIASIPFFEEAIKIDPEYALAYTGLANAYGVLGLTGDRSIPDAVSRARAAERKALEIDDTLGEAHNARCMGLFWYDWDWQSAEQECRRSIEIDPNNADFHGHFAMVLSNAGRHAEALAEAQRSRELNPLNLAQNALEGQFLLYAGRFDEALEQLKKTSDLEPGFWMPHFIAASAYIEKGMFSEAIWESNKEKQLSGVNVFPFGTYALARSGRRDEARAELQELLKLSATKYVPPYNIALIYNALDEKGKALDWLEKGFAQRDPKMTALKVEPKWNNLRNEPRFIDLMKRMKLL
jgi:DNA-binding winged helix-turn-helix (wHTH) protein/TolB-like protein/Tfp pilus assembly protein PilF